MGKSLTELYDAYVDTFREADGKLPPMMELKRIHTAHVVENARAIATDEGFDAETARASGQPNSTTPTAGGTRLAFRQR